MTLMLAGHETSANALSWALHYISRDTEVQERLREEARRVLGTEDEPVKGHLLEQLQYTEQVLWETLRLRPPAWAFDRQAKEKDVLPGGWEVKKGGLILVSPYVSHQDPEVFPDPLVFNPERFDPDGPAGLGGCKLPRFAYYPFSGGPRQCIGASLAMLEMKAVLATLMRTFELSPVPGSLPEPEMDAGVTLSIAGNGLTLRMARAA